MQTDSRTGTGSAPYWKRDNIRPAQGSWGIRREYEDDGACRLYIQHGTVTVCDIGYECPASLHDAHIIESAPDLLHALLLAAATIDRLAPNGSRATRGTVDVINQAVARALHGGTEGGAA